MTSVMAHTRSPKEAEYQLISSNIKTPLVTVDPHDKDDFSDGTYKESKGGGVPVDQLKHKDSSVGAHGETHQESNNTRPSDHFALVLPEVRILVHHCCCDCLCHCEL